MKKRIWIFLFLFLLAGWTPGEITNRLENRYTSLEGECTLREALSHIQRGGGVTFFYEVALPTKKTKIHLINVSLKEGLQKLLTPAGLAFRIGKKGVYILSKKKAPSSSKLTAQEEDLVSLQRTLISEKGKKKLSLLIKKILQKAHLRQEIRFLPPAIDREVSYNFQKISAHQALKNLLQKQKYHFQLEQQVLMITSFRPPTREEMEKSQVLFAEGLRSFALGKLKKALELYKQALGFHRNNSRARMALAKCQEISGQYKSARRNLAFLLKSLPSGKEKKSAQILLSRILAHQGKTKDAIKLLKALLQKDEYNLQATLLLGEFYLSLANPKKAQSSFEGAIEIYQALEDAGGDAYSFTAGACYYLKKLDDCSNMVDWALEKDPFHPWALYYQGLMYFQEKKFTKGKKSLTKLVGHHPFFTRGYFALAEGALARGLSAKQYINKALSINPNHYQAYFLQGKIALGKNKYARGAALFSKATTLKGDFVQARLYLAACYAILKDQTKYRLAKINLLKSHPTLAFQKEIDKILRGRNMSVVQEATMAVKKGRYDQGEKAFLAVLKKDPSNDLAKLGLLKLSFLRGQYSRVIQKLEKMVRTSQEWEAWNLLIRAYQRTGQIKKGLQTALKAQKLFPKNPTFPNLTGEILFLLGRYKKGKEEFTRATTLGDSLNPQHLLAKARANLALNHPHDSNDLFYKVEEISPANSQALCEHALLFIDKYDYGYGRKLLKKLFEFNAHYPPALVAMARCLLEDYTLGSRRYAMARKNIRQALTINPNLEEANLLLASLAILDGNRFQANKIAIKILSINPKSISALAVQATLFFLSGQKKLFDQIEKKALSINPLPYKFYTFLADVVEDHFLYAQSAYFAGKAISLYPSAWRAYTIYGLNLLRIGKETKGKEILEMAHKADKFNVRIYNTLELLDDFGTKYKLYPIHPKIGIRMDVKEAKILLPYAKALLDKAIKSLGPRYKFKITSPLLIEFFSSHRDFSVRTIGLPRIGALGVCFGKVVALDSPRALPPGQYNWGRTLWHEFTHVITLAKTKHRIPRWFTEGLSVYEEARARPSWDREYEKRFLQVLNQGRIRGIARLNEGFTRPRYRDEVLVCYYQGGLVVEFIVKKWGFDKILAMLNGYKQRWNTPKVLQKVLETSTKSFDRGFFAFLKKRFQSIRIGPSYSSNQIDTFKEEAEKKPKSADLWVRLALAHIFSGHMIDGEIAVGKALALDGKNGDGLAGMGLIELQRGNKKASRQYFEKALKNKTHLAYRIHKILARFYLQKKNKKQALIHLEKAHKLYKRDVSILHQLVKLYDSTGQKAKALKMRLSIVSIQERDLSTRQYLMNYYRAKGKWKEVIDIGQAFLLIQPYIPGVHSMLAQAYERLKQYGPALLEYQALLSLQKTPSPKIYIALARVCIGLGKREKARQYLIKALEIDSQNKKAKKMLDGLGS